MINYYNLTKEDMELEQYLLQCYNYVINNSPDGNLINKLSGTSKRYYHATEIIINGQKQYSQKYLGAKDQELIDGLKRRKIAEQAIKTIEQNIKIQNSVLKKYTPYDPHSLRESLPEAYRDIKGNCFITGMLPQWRQKLSGGAQKKIQSNQIQARQTQLGQNRVGHTTEFEGFNSWEEWAKVEYPTNPYNADKKTFPTTSGNMVRSKGEVIIAECSSLLHVPFRYEQRIMLLDETGHVHYIYPDFIFPNRVYGKYYWEHCGMFNDKGYFENFCRKLELYHMNGISLGKNLIVTADDCEGNIDAANIRQILEAFIVPYI